MKKQPDKNIKLQIQALLGWYDHHARELPWRVGPIALAEGGRPDPYHVWLSEVMCQQTRVQTVIPYFLKFIAKWPEINALAAADLQAINVAWSGLGYYRRARNLHACARELAARGSWPQSAMDWQELPGIGPYTSAMLAAILHEEAIVVMDGNIERIMARVFAEPRPLPEAKRILRDRAEPYFAHGNSGNIAQALMDIGSKICTPVSPDCLSCPLQSDCAASKTPSPALFPKRAQKKARPQKYGHAFVLVGKEQVFLQKRPATGLLAGLSEVPGTKWQLAPVSALRMETLSPPVPGNWQSAGTVRHVFTHFSLELSVWCLQVETCPQGLEGWWTKLDALEDEALPSLMRKVIECGLQHL